MPYFRAKFTVQQIFPQLLGNHTAHGRWRCSSYRNYPCTSSFRSFRLICSIPRTGETKTWRAGPAALWKGGSPWKAYWNNWPNIWRVFWYPESWIIWQVPSITWTASWVRLQAIWHRAQQIFSPAYSIWSKPYQRMWSCQLQESFWHLSLVMSWSSWSLLTIIWPTSRPGFFSSGCSRLS